MAGGPWQWQVLVPAHRITLGLLGDEVVETRGASSLECRARSIASRIFER